MCTWFLRKMFSEVSSERVPILIIRNFLRYVLEVLFHSFFVSVLSISNVKVTTSFESYLVNDTTFLTFTSVCTFTFYFGTCVTVAFSTDKIFSRGSKPAKVGFWVSLRIFSYVRTPTKLTNSMSKTQLLG